MPAPCYAERVSRVNVYRVFCYAGALAILTAILKVYLDICFHSPFFDSFELMLNGLVAGTAPRPYVTRALIPFLLRLTSQLLSVDLAATLVMSLSLIAFLPALHYLAAAFWRPSPRRDLAVLLTATGVAVPALLMSRWVYDFPTLLLFTVAFGLMARRRWGLYLVVYLLCALDRETAILLTAVFALYFYRRRLRSFYPLLAIQAILYLASRGLIAWFFQSNPGEWMYLTLAEQLDWLATLPLYFSGFSVFGWFTGLVSLAILAVPLLLAHRWQERPAFLRSAVVGAGLPLLLLFFIGGKPLEVRVFYEVYAPLSLAVLSPFLPMTRQPLILPPTKEAS